MIDYKGYTGFYCEVCGAVCNLEQGCKHHPLTTNANDDKAYMPDVVKDLFNLRDKQNGRK